MIGLRYFGLGSNVSQNLPLSILKNLVLPGFSVDEVPDS